MSFAPPVPGALIVFSVEQPLFARLELAPNVPARWARYDLGGVRIEDSGISREEHLELRFSDGKFHLENRSSKGSHLNGQRFDGRVVAEPGSVLRIGKTLVLLVADVRPYTHVVEIESVALGGGSTQQFVIGPLYRDALERIASARARNRNIVIFAERGAGKEFAANHFHRSHKNPGPFKRFNCSQFSEGLAGPELFGVMDGVATGVKERQGMLIGAHKGVLFLDEIAELPLSVQPKFLRAIDPGEVTPEGWKKEEPIRVDVRYVCASNQRMADRVSQGQFRGDLYDRLRQEEIDLPPLRARREEIPWLMHLQTEAAQVGLHCSAVEAALLCPWPGNVRQLISVTEEGLGSALKAKSDLLRAEHLKFPPAAGAAFAAPPVPPRTPPDGGSSPPVPPSVPPSGSPPAAPAAAKRPRPTKEELLAELVANGWNRSRTARTLGMHRTQLNRDIDEYGLTQQGPSATLAGDDDEEAE